MWLAVPPAGRPIVTPLPCLVGLRGADRRSFLSIPGAIFESESVEARQRRFGGGDAGHVSAVRRRKEIGRTGFAGKKQTVVDWGGERRAVVGVAGRRVRIGAARPGVLQPGGRGERRDLPSDVVAEEARELTGREREHCRLPIPFERRRPTSAEEAVNRRPIEWPHLIAHRFPRSGRADEERIGLDPQGRTRKRDEQLVV